MTTFFEDYTKLINSIDAIGKTKEGYGYTYLELTPLLDIVMPKLTENNFILVQTTRQVEGVFTRDTEEPAIYEKKIDKDHKERIVEGVCRKHIETPAYVLHSELIHKSGEKIECDMPMYVDDIDPQAIGSAETYMRRYSIYTLLNIRTKDNDGLDASSKGKANKVIQEGKAPLPQNVEEIATFLASQSNPKIYYRDVLNRADIPADLLRKLKKIMYP
jgi:hypothetical protein